MDWDSFKILQPKSKEIILDTLREMFRPTPWLRYHDTHIEDYSGGHCICGICRDNEHEEE